MLLVEQLKIVTFAQTVYKKCECCGRVRDIFFKLNVFDSKTNKMLVGDFDLCKFCGENLGDILKIDTAAENTVRNFSFTR